MLSREAIIHLRAPRYLSSIPPSPGYTHPSPKWLEMKWHVSHSTDRVAISSQRNVRFELSLLPSPRSTNSSAQKFTAVRSYQDIDSPAIHSCTFELACDAHDTGVLAGVVGTTSDDDGGEKGGLKPETKTKTTIQVLAWGKEGQQEDWMIDKGDGWIYDSSGECRAEWRNSYVVVYVVDGDDGDDGDLAEEKGLGGNGVVEVWERWGPRNPLLGPTMEKIKAALKGVGGGLGEELERVKTDEERERLL